MKLLKLLPLFLLLSILIVGSTSAYTEPFWIDGTVQPTPTQIMYDGFTHWVFNFSVTNSNVSWVNIGGAPVTVACPTSLLTDGFTVGGFYNVSGMVVNGVGETTEIPLDTFVVTAITFTTYSDWTDIILQIIGILTSVVSGIARTIVELLALTLGVVIPELFITLLLIGGLTFFLIKNLKAISIVIALVVVFLIATGGLNVFRLLIMAG